MLRKCVPKQRIFLTNAERERLVLLGNAIGPGVAKLITISTQEPTSGGFRATTLEAVGKRWGDPRRSNRSARLSSASPMRLVGATDACRASSASRGFAVPATRPSGVSSNRRADAGASPSSRHVERVCQDVRRHALTGRLLQQVCLGAQRPAAASCAGVPARRHASRIRIACELQTRREMDAAIGRGVSRSCEVDRPASQPCHSRSRRHVRSPIRRCAEECVRSRAPGHGSSP